MNALDKQVAGDHYKTMKIQPMELGYMVGGTPVFRDVAKYIMRDKGDHIENVQKAIHCIELERELIEYCGYYKKRVTGSTHMIRMFTDNKHFRGALLNLRDRRYNSAIERLKEYLASIK